MAAMMQKQGIQPDGNLSVDRVNELKSVLSELQEMKIARERTEEMVLGLIQQRDMLKMMLEQEKKANAGGVAGDGDSQSSATPAADAARTEQALADLTWQLQQANAEVERLTSKASRLAQVEGSLEEGLSKAKADSAEARMKAAHFEGEYTFQRERVERLEEAIAASQKEVDSQMARLVEGEKRLLGLQEIVSEKDETIIAKQEELKAKTDECMALVVEASTAKEAERRVRSQMEQMKNSIKSRESLEESVRRVEMGLSSRLEEEKVQLRREKDALSRSIETLRKQTGEKSAASDQRIKRETRPEPFAP